MPRNVEGVQVNNTEEEEESRLSFIYSRTRSESQKVGEGKCVTIISVLLCTRAHARRLLLLGV